MSILGTYNITPQLSGDVGFSDDFAPLVANPTSPGEIRIVDLLIGDNTITVPTGGATVAVAALIIPPVGNVDTLTLKGLAADAGISLHLTNPSIVSLNVVASFVLTTLVAIPGVRIIFI